MNEIPDKLWEDQMKTIASQNVSSKFVEGILWWDADTYFYERPEAANMRKEYKGSLQNFILHNDLSTVKKAEIINKVLESKR